MRMNFIYGQNMFGTQIQNPLQRSPSQVQSSGLQKVIQQVNANYGSRKNCDTVDLSKKALEVLDALSARKEEGTKKPEASSDYQKYAPVRLRQVFCHIGVTVCTRAIQIVFKLLYF